MLLLVYVHGYNLQDNYLRPFTTVDEPLTITTFVEYWLSNGIFRFRIPMLFIISGYLYAYNDHQPQWQRLKKRIPALAYPYLIWSVLAILFTLLLLQFPATALAVTDAHLFYQGDFQYNSLTNGIKLFFRYIAAPISFQLWFIRDLLWYNAIYPFMKKMALQHTQVWFYVVLTLWLTSFALPLIKGEGLLYFSLGIYLAKTNKNVLIAPKWINLRIFFLLFIVVSLLKTWLAFLPMPPVASVLVLSLLHKITEVAGLTALWYGGDKLVQFFMQQKWFLWASKFSFFIYVAHAPFLYYITHYLMHQYQAYAYHRMVIYLFVPLFTTLFMIAIGAICRKILPRFYQISTGGRGM